jgi:hypothetical protein
MEIDEDFEILNNESNAENLNTIKNEIHNLIRTEHMNIEEKHKIINLIKQYPEIIKREQDLLTATDLITHKILTTDEEPVYARNYRYPQIFKEDVKIEIEKLLKNKIIQPSNSPYNSPVWVVPKKPDASGKRKIRMVIDYRKLNLKTQDDRYPLPNIEDLFGKIGRATYFSAIDLASGFHQIKLDKDSIQKTAFSTEDGHYEFLRLPFGLKNSPPSFQRAMNLIFANLENVLVYMDDIIVFSDNLEEHLKHLKTVFERLKNHNLKIQLDKTEFFKKELLFLGHIISKEGIKPNPIKLEAIKNFPIPKTVKQIKQFLGLTGYYRKMIKGYAKIAKPITAMLKLDTKINTSDPEYLKAIETLKNMLINEPILQLPDFNKQFILTTDASNYAIGAVLSQNFEGKDLPISFASRTLNKHEERLSTIEKELLAIVWACKHFRPYIYGRKTLINSDHKPLQYLHNMKEPSAKILRWKCQLADYDLEIKYIKGKTNYVADALSRNPPQELNVLNRDEILERFLASPNNPQFNNINDNELEELTQQLNEDLMRNNNNDNNNNDNDSFVTIHSQISSNDQIYIVDDPNKFLNVEKYQIIIKRGNPNRNKNEKIFKTKTRLTWYTAWPYSNDLEENCIEFLQPNITYGVYCSDKTLQLETKMLDQIFNKFQGIIEDKFPTVKIKRYYKVLEDIEDRNDQIELIINQHCGKTCHRGINDVHLNLKKKYYWPAMLTEITNYINNCEICKRVKYDRNPPRPEYQITPTPEKPFDKLQMDTLFYDNKQIFTIIDCFSKKLSAYEINNTNGIEIINKLKEYLSNFPAPIEIQADNGTEFANKGIENFLKYNNIKIHFTTPHHHNSNGLINRAHSTLIEIMNIIKSKDKNITITNLIRTALIAYNNTPNKNLKLTPNEITFGITKHTEESQQLILEQNTENYHKEKLIIQNAIKQMIEKEKELRTESLNKNRENIVIPQGEIYVRTNTRNKAKDKFKKVTYDNKSKTIKTKKNKNIKLHPSQMKRPNKTNKKILRSRQTIENDTSNPSNSPRPGPSGL